MKPSLLRYRHVVSITTAPELYWDPFDTVIDTDPYPVWKRLRDEAPVYRNDRFDFYALSRFADVEAGHKDPATFLSGRGTVLELMSGADMSHTGQMIFMDPPDHTTLRSLVSRAFTPRRTSGLEGRVRQLCAELLDPHVGSGGFDYFKDFAAHLPSRVISALLGVPDDEREEQRQNIDGIFHIEPDVGMINDTSFMAQVRLHEYLSGLAERRRSHPQDDLISDLCRAEITQDGQTRQLTQDEVVGFSTLLFSAGTETVGRLLGNAAVVLAAHPDQRRILVEDHAVIPNAVEELLRFEPPSPVQGRWTTREVELHGTTIPADSKVLLLTGSGVARRADLP